MLFYGRETARNITLQHGQKLHQQIGDLWSEFVDGRPDGWSGEYELDEMWPLIIGLRYGQNVKIRSPDVETRNAEVGVWMDERNYTGIAKMSFAIATHLR
jgi:hypothetical protein